MNWRTRWARTEMSVVGFEWSEGFEIEEKDFFFPAHALAFDALARRNQPDSPSPNLSAAASKKTSLVEERSETRWQSAKQPEAEA